MYNSDETTSKNGFPTYLNKNIPIYSDKEALNVTVTFNESDKIEDNEEPIFELLKPDEIFVLYKDSDAVVYVGNKDGKLFIEKSLWKDAVKSE